MTTDRVTPEYVAFVDAMLRGLDPRLPEDARQEALLEAAAEPEYVVGALAGILFGYHTRAEEISGRPAGSMVDALRAKLFAPLPADDVIGYAVHSAGPGDVVRFVPVDVAPDATHAERVAAHAEARAAALRIGGTPEDRTWMVRRQDGTVAPTTAQTDPPVKEQARQRTVAEAAAQAEAARRARIAAEMTGQPGGALSAPAEPTTTDLLPELAAKAAGNPELAALLARVHDRQRQAQDPELPPAPVTHLPATPSPTASTFTSNGGNATPAGEQAPAPLPACGHQTASGPCALRAGHPVAPGFPGEDGHMSEEMLS